MVPLNPAALRALIRAAGSKSPVTSKVPDLGLAVSRFTPSTFLTAALIAVQQEPQQLWTPLRVTL